MVTFKKNLIRILFALRTSQLARSEVLTVVLLRFHVSWYVTPCRLVSTHRRFEGARCRNLQGHSVEERCMTLKVTRVYLLDVWHCVTFQSF